MQPSKPPPSVIEQRMAEYEEAVILMIKLSMPPKDDEWTEALLKLHVDMKSRLVTLLESMMRRRTERELRDGPYQPPPEKRVVTEDSEI